MKKNMLRIPKSVDSPHSALPRALFTDVNPFIQIYWVTEDRLGPLYDSQAYDRGLHMLVGSEAHRGVHRIRTWLPSLVHYCFLDDARTNRVVAEPNEKNGKMVAVSLPACFD